jgi:thioredoxin 1
MTEIVQELTNGEFNDFIKDGTALIDFFADWCMPCVMMGPIIEDIAERFDGKIKFGKVNIEDYSELAQKYNVSSLPNFVVFKDGKVLEQFMGSMNEEEFENKLKEVL